MKHAGYALIKAALTPKFPLKQREAVLVKESRAVADTLSNLYQECALTSTQRDLLRVAIKRLHDASEVYGGEYFWQIEDAKKVEGE